MRLPLPSAAALATIATCAGSLLAQQPPDFTATTPLTVLNTDSTVVNTSAGPRVVTGGVFRFHNVTIPVGTVVRGVGSRPLIILADNVAIDGELSVSGADGERVNTLNAANFPSPGGVAGAAGGNGGAGSPDSFARSFTGQAGFGPGNGAGSGGGGGIASLPLAPSGSFTFGSGGGGGAFATVGDPDYPFRWTTGTSFVQQLGLGGFGGAGSSGASTRALPGGGPGRRPFVDGDDENDFFGPGYDVFARREVPGELPFLTGGGGGGGGGDRGHDLAWLPPGFAFMNDNKGGGGGGGGGCLVLVASNSIQVGVTGRVTADGGRGGGGEQAGSCNQGGGGGGGAGGLMILVAGIEIALEVHGETYANQNYDFVLSADGGVCRTGAFLSPDVEEKYPTVGGSRQGPLTISGTLYDSRGLGGFGGLGIVEMMTPVGNNSDGTNTILDDNIRLVQNGVTLTGAQKQRFLAWRGWKNAAGVRIDDFGNPVQNAGDGDIRPAPVLLPLR